MNEPSARVLLEMRSVQGDRVIRPLGVFGVHAILKIPLAAVRYPSPCIDCNADYIPCTVVDLKNIKTSTNWDCGRISDHP